MLLILIGCKRASTDLHDGEYIFIDKTKKHTLRESITIKGTTATLHMRSLFNSKKLSKSTFLCLHYPDRVDLQVRRQPPISIPVDKEGNLIWDEKLFKKQPILLIQPAPIPEAILEATE